MRSELMALAGRMRRIVLDLEQVVRGAESLMQKAKQTGDDGYLDGVALNLHGFYSGAERLFEDIARTLERALPSGAGWHQDLLLQMSAEVPAIRPPVLRQETRNCLDEYRGFRHVVRNVYTFQLHPSRLEQLAQQLGECFNSLKEDIDEFGKFLAALADTSNEKLESREAVRLESYKP